MSRPGGTTHRACLRAASFTLGLSSGFFGFFAHAGAVAALEEEGFLQVAAGEIVAVVGANGPSSRDAGRPGGSDDPGSFAADGRLPRGARVA